MALLRHIVEQEVVGAFLSRSALLKRTSGTPSGLDKEEGV